MHIKAWLKRNSWLYEANARYKAQATKKQYYDTVAYYASKKEAKLFAELLRERLGNRLNKLKKLNRLPNIFFLGTDEFQDRSGTVQALEKLGKLTVYKQASGTYGLGYSGTHMDRVKINTERLWAMVQQLDMHGETPDMIIGQMWGSLIDGSVLRKIKATFNTLILNIAMDDRHQYSGRKFNGGWSGTYELIPHIDLALTAAPECVEWYMKEGCPAMYFPEASDPDIFHPMPELSKTEDVSFVGGCYGIRKRIVEAIQAAGINVAAYGNGWSNGRIPIEDVPKLFARSRIVLGVGTIGHCTDFFSLKMRDFDVPMSGSLYLTHHNPDLEKLFVIGTEIDTYHTPKECIEKVRYFLTYPDEAIAIGRAGRLRAEKEHTWEKRFKRLFNLLGLSV